jgi:protein-disulfide isomerase
MEFSDYQCPFCGKAFQETLPLIERDYIRTGKLRYVFRDFPLSIHKDAPKAAEAANCAGEQGSYWKMHDQLFLNQKALGLKDLPRYAGAIGLDPVRFQECLDSGKHAGEVQKDMEEGRAAGVTGTPSFFLGVAEGPKTMRVQKQIVGAQPYDVIKAAIEEALAALKK